MVNLGQVLEFKFGPQLNYEVRDASDSKGPYLALWDEALMGRARPTDQEFAQWETEMDTAKVIEDQKVSELRALKAKLARGEDLTRAELRVALGKLLK